RADEHRACPLRARSPIRVTVQPIRPTRLPARAEEYIRDGLWSDQTIWNAFVCTAARHPGRTALVEGDIRLAFSDLAERADALASGMSGLGITPGDAIAFQLPNWWETIVVLLAAARMGAVGVPVRSRAGGGPPPRRAPRPGARSSGPLPRLRSPRGGGGAPAGAPGPRRGVRGPRPAVARDADARDASRDLPGGAGSERRAGRRGAGHLHVRDHRRSEGRAAFPPDTPRRGQQPRAFPRARRRRHPAHALSACPHLPHRSRAPRAGCTRLVRGPDAALGCDRGAPADRGGAGDLHGGCAYLPARAGAAPLATRRRRAQPSPVLVRRRRRRPDADRRG